MICQYRQCMSNSFWFIENRILKPPLRKCFLDLMTLTFMTLKNQEVVVMYTYTTFGPIFPSHFRRNLPEKQTNKQTDKQTNSQMDKK